MNTDKKSKIIKIVRKNDEANISLNVFLEKMLIISSEMSNGINQLNKKFDDKMDLLEKRILNIENKLNIPNQELEQKETINLLEIKSEILNIDKKEVLKALKYNDYRSFMYIFKLYYKNDKNNKYVYPIKIISVRSFEYYYNGKWNKDLYGNHIINILCGNIQSLFLKYNTLDDDTSNITCEDFIMNQYFIHKLSDEKYKKEILKHIVEELKINSE